jgi:hypothetical protein
MMQALYNRGVKILPEHIEIVESYLIECKPGECTCLDKCRVCHYRFPFGFNPVPAYTGLNPYQTGASYTVPTCSTYCSSIIEADAETDTVETYTFPGLNEFMTPAGFLDLDRMMDTPFPDLPIEEEEEESNDDGPWSW